MPRTRGRQCWLCGHRPNRYHRWVDDRCDICGKWKEGTYERSIDSFWEKVEKGDGCWLWKGGVAGFGYGYHLFEGKMRKAHRVAWKLAHGEWPKETIDHLCGTRLCVRVDHMEDVSHAENVRRAVLQEVCKNGHRMAETRVKKNGSSYCGQCRREARAV